MNPISQMTKRRQRMVKAHLPRSHLWPGHRLQGLSVPSSCPSRRDSLGTPAVSNHAREGVGAAEGCYPPTQQHREWFQGPLPALCPTSGFFSFPSLSSSNGSTGLERVHTAPEDTLASPGQDARAGKVPEPNKSGDHPASPTSGDAEPTEDKTT